MTYTFIVAPSEARIRLDVFLSEKLPDLTRSRIKKIIEEKLVSLNNNPVKSSAKIKSGDQINIVIPAPQPIHAEPEEIPIDIIYEDKHIIIINKLPGIAVHPGAGRIKGTLVNALLYHCKGLSQIGGKLRPGIVHRLDKDTSGVMVIAKTDACYKSLSEQFKEHTVKKRYLTIVWGIVKKDADMIDFSIGRHLKDRKKMAVGTRGGKKAVTHYKVIKRFKNFTILEVIIETGRTHQIRVHLSAIHYPVVGDPVYGKSSIPSCLSPKLIMLLKNFKRQALHAKNLGIIHPETKEYMEFKSPLPDDMKEIIDTLQEEDC